MIDAYLAVEGHHSGSIIAAPGCDPVTNFPQFSYSMGQVKRAGDFLSGHVLWTSEASEEIKDMFRIANNWRDSHAYPMSRIRYEVIGLMRRIKIKGVTAARVKRMRSIRKKLRTGIGLNRIQDLAGCRAILPSISDVHTLIDYCRANMAHEVAKESPYLASPKVGGYRSHHIVFKFRGEGDGQAFDGRRIELQIRSKMQHSWATAVEAVGLFRNEDLKGGVGDENWLRLFELMSSEIAFAEGCPEVPGAPIRSERVKEIRDLEARLNAARTLDDWSHAVRFTETYISERAKYFLIRYNYADKTVDVSTYSSASQGASSYDRSDDQGSNSVLVEADKIEGLKEAYPNYFGDVQTFLANLKRISSKGEAQEYSLAPQETVRQSRETPDYSWLRSSTRPKVHSGRPKK